jgi:peptidyl-dipeptidase Dcp
MSWVIGNTRSFVEPFLTFSNNRELEAKVWRMYVKGVIMKMNDNKANPCSDFAKGLKKSKITWLLLESEQ